MTEFTTDPKRIAARAARITILAHDVPALENAQSGQPIIQIATELQ